MNRLLILVYLCLVVLCIDTYAVYVNVPALCSRTKCSVSADHLVKFKYLQGVVYRYAYQIDVSTNLGVTLNDRRNESTLQIDAVVSLSFTSPCEGHLKLTESSISSNRSTYDAEFPDRAGAEFVKNVEQYALRFAFRDGEILEVCPHPEEPVWVLNMKKGVLSMFQNTMKRFDVSHSSEELDINGICHTHYKLYEARQTSLLLKKTKNIASCTNRNKYLSVLQSNSYRSPFSSNPRSFREPLLKSSSDCEITLDHNIYEAVTCVDVHMLRPLSNGRRAGATSITRSSLNLIEEVSDFVDVDEGEGEDFPLSKRVNLLYNHVVTLKPTHGELRTSRNSLKSMCKMRSGEQLQEEFSKVFTKFIHSARLLNYPSLSMLLLRADSICRTGRKHIINALPYIESTAALMVQKDLIIRKQVPLEKVKDWISGFALIPRPDKETLRALAPLLEHQSELGDSQFDLAYSSIIHAYCTNVDNDCLRVEPVTRFLRYVEAKIEKGCRRKSHSTLETKQTLEALKSIGNMGLEIEGLREILKGCIEGAGGYLTMETRVAAIDAHRRLPSCQETRDAFFLNLYRNSSQDTELRIASYLQVMRCPDYNVIKIIKHTLKEEEVNQVGSFVWSHLKNLLKSSSPSRIEVQSLLMDRDLGKKFDSDIRKFSRNYESSFFSDEYNVGANYQTNLIFSPKSYIPRTATINATVDVLGESINMFEVAIRFEGIEYYAENFFGPNGPLSNEKVSLHFKNFLRSLRSVNSENTGENYAEKIKNLPNVIDNNFDNPTLSFSLKIFGNDVQYVTLTGDKEIRTTIASLDPWAKLMKILSGNDVKYEKTGMFLDSSYVVPTTSGLPLHLSASGSTACNFKMSGSLNNKRLGNSEALEIMGNIMPSVSVDVTGTMVIDAFYKSAGIKLKSNLYSSGAVQGHLIVKDMQLVSLNLGLPNEKIEVFSMLTDVTYLSTNGPQTDETPVGLIVSDQSTRELKKHNLIQIVSNNTCSWAALDKIIGLKLCTTYQFSNVTKNPNAAYFVLNGPTLFKVSLMKTDKTIKSYLFEYKWQRSENKSNITMVFDTPGSLTKREMSAQISFDANNRNVSVVLRAAGSLLVAKGTYKKTDDQFLIDLGLDVNSTKHLDASIGYTRVLSHHGYNYSPKLYLAINNERVVEVSGTVQITEKGNVSQSDINLLFETKKFWSQIRGYIMRKNASVSGNINVEYQLKEIQGSAAQKKETVQVEVSLSNQSQKGLTHKAATFKLQSSAYPHLNINMGAWYRQALGHLEIHTEINSNPHLHDDKHKFTAQLVITNSRTYLSNEGAKITAFIAITKPIQNLDIKVGVSHFSRGVKTISSGLIRYAPGKEIALLTTVKMPRGAMFDIEAHVNLTIPTFTPMLIDIDIKEKTRNEYDVKLAGTWFSGHNMTAHGTYTDHSTVAIIDHTVKLLLDSPSFAKDVVVNLKIYNDATDLKVDLQLEQSEQEKYGLIVTHGSLTTMHFLSYLECRYKSNVYSLTANVDKEREARIEVHLDRWKDVHLIARAIDEPNKKEAGLEIKWDANRDPDLKFATSFQFVKFSDPTEKNFSTIVMVTYPGRLVTGSSILALRGRNNYVSDIRVEWSPVHAVHFTINADYNMEPTNKIFKIESQLLTPFELWKRTSLDARYMQNSNAVTARGSVHWQDSQHFSIDLSGTLIEDDKVLEWQGNYKLVSTMHPLKWMNGNLTHRLSNGRKTDTRLHITYYPDKVLDLKSSWDLIKGKDGSFNLTGVLNMISPLAAYERGDVTCSLQFTPNWKIRGAVYVDLDKRKYTGNLVGDLAKIKESMVQFNLTTPIERFSTLQGNFGLSEKDRHVVARIDGPHGSVGLEALIQLFLHGSDFNFKLEVATPIELLEHSLVVAKLNKKEADFRVGYRNMTAGFVGVWRYQNLTDFHHTYILYTPMDGFEECGIVTKLVVENGPEIKKMLIDSEFSIRFSDTKFGVTANGGPKPPPFSIPEIPDPVASSAEVLYDYIEDEEPLYWQGQILIDLALFETIVGDLDIEQNDPNFKVLGSLKIPSGTIRLDDRFRLDDYVNMKNELKIDTPFQSASEITSTYILSCDLINNDYFVATDLRVKNHANWMEAGYNVNYTNRGAADDLQTHDVMFRIKTPLKFVLYVDGKIYVEVDENLYKGKFDLSGNDFEIDLLGSYESDDGYLDTMMQAKINSSKFIVPKTRIIIKKDLTSRESQMEFGLKIYEPVLKVYNLQGVWQVEGTKFMNATLQLNSPIEMLEHVRVSIHHANSISENESAKLNLDLVYRTESKFKIIGDYKDKIVSGRAITPIKNYETLEFLGNVLKVSNELLEFEGDLTSANSAEPYKVYGQIVTKDETVMSVDATIVPAKNSMLKNNITLSYVKETYGFKFQTINSPRDLAVDFSCRNILNWNTGAKIYSADRNQIDFELVTFVNTQVNGNVSVYVRGKTPFKSIKNFMVSGDMLLSNVTGSVQANHHFNQDRSYIEFKWGLLYLEDMYANVLLDYEINKAKKHVETKLFFKDPHNTRRNINTGFDVNIDHELWTFGSNATIGFIDTGNVDAIFSLTLPPPEKDCHTVLVSYHLLKEPKNTKYAVGYNTQVSKINYASDGSLTINPQDINAHLRFTWGLESHQTVNNFVNVSFQPNEISFDYSLRTPKFLQEETFILRLEYSKASTAYNIINTDVYYPSSKRLGTARIVYASLANVNGSFNASTPIEGIPYIACNFVVYTTIKNSKRHVEAFWPGETALLKSEYTYNSEKLDSTLEGSLQAEIPLSTRHSGLLKYGYKKRPLITTGHSELIYNSQRIVHGEYNSKSESRAGFEKDRIEITIQNSFKPLGIVYINQYEYSGGNAGTNYPTTELKQVDVYRLGNLSDFHIAGETLIRTTHTGQDIQIKAVHLNRTVNLRTDYKILPGEFDHNARLSLASDAWASYHVNILNKTTEEVENQFVVLDFVYPRRNFTLDASYSIGSSDINSEAILQWDRDMARPRSVGTGFQWKKLQSTDLLGQRQAVLSFKHPSFKKDVTFTAKYDRTDPSDFINVALVVDYSKNSEKLLVLRGKVRDESSWPADRKYSYEIFGQHPITNLDLRVNGTLHKHMFVFVKVENHGSYKRSFFPVEKGQLYGYIDLSKYEIELLRENKEVVKHLKTRYYPTHPEYILNGSLVYTPDIDATGQFYLNIDEKLTWLMVNYTPDAVESLRMYGKIPDARNVVFDIWRTYSDDLTIADVSFYLRLNHSKLVTSKMTWRPELKEDVMSTVKDSFNEAYESIGNDAEYWKQYIRSETVSAIYDIWEDAHEDVSKFLEDWNNLKELQTDLEDLEIYLNKSYNANEFYVKDIVAFGSFVIDDLSLRSHMQSLPNIFNEIWEIMGESGQAVRNSLLWAIEAVKSGYNKLSEIVTAMLKGDSMAQIASIIEKFVEKYDKFVKDLHVSFIKWMENLWANMSTAASDQWTKFLRYVEPLFIKVIHYLETVVWKASKEVLDFLYDRRNEIITSPYFDRFTNFTQDVDRIYKDIQAHDIVTNVRKYSGIIITFIRERYFTMVPFGVELKNVVDEIINELLELTKLPFLHYTIEKVQQLYAKAKYLYEYFEVGDQINHTIKFIHSKLTDISQTALQAENRYREAKTKFIFSPEKGLLHLEQKLPMSWHAFNQTPEFQEIAEYRAISDLKSYFVTSNLTFWTLYYQYKPYTEPSSWLPPFKAQAMIAGGQHYMTFDGRYYEFSGECTYLLAHDFVHNQFSVLIKYSVDELDTSHQIIVVTGGNAIQLDVFKNSVRLLDSQLEYQLPAEIGNGQAYVYQEASIVIVESRKKLFRLECNMKFDLCTLELSGWYYGKTAGLFGTMSNEQSDDFLNSYGTISTDIGAFAQSWSLNRTQCTTMKNRAFSKPAKNDELKICEELFANKNSEFSSCFNTVNPNPFETMCFNSRSEKEACNVAVSYIQICLFHDTYIRIPDKCTKCTLVDGSEVAEGSFRKLEGKAVPKSSDIVFIVEAKNCNKNIKSNASMELFISQLKMEFNELQLDNLRWSLVTFGADGVYNQPRSLVINGDTFTSDHKHFMTYFDHVPIGNGTQDIFAALRYASLLEYRAGVSKTFILLPCSHCDPQHQMLDYSVLHQVMLEHEVTLHILVDADFQLEKERIGKVLYGFDASKSYTKKDTRVLTGDKELHRQVKLSKSILGYCTPLALETNGTVFSGKKLRFEKPTAIKKFISVFSKRIATSATPGTCQHCECNADNNGRSTMECTPCVDRLPIAVDYKDFDENESLSMLQPLGFDYNIMDLDE
ncbi:uncharacterized protein LOC124305239 [Neodiprion virginianus]|uniref:uncharacterized protein LOC124305239 n=1 Tax=Neodiprion virginianus TaxID=2961670 RepID=UPI001EE6C971|nr:uncharacterized protein LOC124305239 [Neodiprion virginianus]